MSWVHIRENEHFWCRYLFGNVNSCHWNKPCLFLDGMSNKMPHWWRHVAAVTSLCHMTYRCWCYISFDVPIVFFATNVARPTHSPPLSIAALRGKLFKDTPLVKTRLKTKFDADPAWDGEEIAKRSTNVQTNKQTTQIIEGYCMIC